MKNLMISMLKCMRLSLALIVGQEFESREQLEEHETKHENLSKNEG